MTTLSNTRDLTAVVRCAQPSPHMLMTYLCGKPQHKGLRTGGLFRGKIGILCPACNMKEKP